MRYHHLALPYGIQRVKGIPAGTKDQYIRIDKLQILVGDIWCTLNGRIVTVCNWQVRKRYTVHGAAIVDGIAVDWLLDRNGIIIQKTQEAAA